MTGNKGEWSELYTLFKLLGDGKLYGADENIEKLESVCYDILKIIRTQTDGKWEYERSSKISIISVDSGEKVMQLTIDEFLVQSKKLFEALKSLPKKSSSFELAETWNFAESIKCNTLKAKSKDKADITVMVHDVKTGSNPTLGFSIKSQLGSPSTLLNASSKTNLLYSISGRDLTDVEIEKFNSIASFYDKFNYLNVLGVGIEYSDTSSESFLFNMKLVDTKLPELVAELVEEYYRSKCSIISELTKKVVEKNCLNICNNDAEIFYGYKIKEFLTNIALGMVPGTK